MAKYTAAEQKVVDAVFELTEKVDFKAVAEYLDLTPGAVSFHVNKLKRKKEADGTGQATAPGPSNGKAKKAKGTAAAKTTMKATAGVPKKSKNGAKTAAKAKTTKTKAASQDEASPEMDDFVFSIEKEGSAADQVADGDDEDEF